MLKRVNGDKGSILLNPAKALFRHIRPEPDKRYSIIINEGAVGTTGPAPSYQNFNISSICL